MPGGIARTQLDRPAQQHDAFFRIARHGGHDSLQRQRRRMIWHRGEDVGADAAGFVEPFGLGGRLGASKRLLRGFAIDGGTRLGRLAGRGGWCLGSSRLLDSIVSAHDR